MKFTWEEIMAKKFKKGEAMVKEFDDCHHCNTTGSIQVSVNGEGYWCRKCGYGGTMAYAVEDSP